jgi:hypothetical protein
MPSSLYQTDKPNGEQHPCPTTLDTEAALAQFSLLGASIYANPGDIVISAPFHPESSWVVMGNCRAA